MLKGEFYCDTVTSKILAQDNSNLNKEDEIISSNNKNNNNVATESQIDLHLHLSASTYISNNSYSMIEYKHRFIYIAYLCFTG